MLESEKLAIVILFQERNNVSFNKGDVLIVLGGGFSHGPDLDILNSLHPGDPIRCPRSNTRLPRREFYAYGE